MSNEHLKTMVMLLRRQILQHEQNSGIKVDVPSQVLAQLGVAREDWDAFWS